MNSCIPATETRPANEGLMKEQHTWFFLLLSVLTPLLVSFYIYTINPRFYFIDDKVSEAIPKFYDMGRMMRQGEFPSLTTSIMCGSAYAMEYQYGVFNPVQLLACYLLPSFANHELAAWFLAAVYLVLTGAGGFILGKNLGLNNIRALVLSTLISLNYHGLYWNASAWHDALMSSTWIVFCLAFLAGFMREKSSAYQAIGLFVSYVLCLTCGCPLGVAVAAISSLVVLIHLAWIRKDWRSCCLIIASGIAALMVATTSLISLFSASAVSGRSYVFCNRHNFLVAPLDGLIAFFDPAYYAYFHTFDGYRLQRTPQFFAGWFLLPLVVMIDWSREKWRLQGIWVWGVLALIAMVTTMGPERLGYIRFPIRSMPYYHIFLIMLVFFSAHILGLRITRTRMKLWGLLLFLQWLHAMQACPDRAFPITLVTTLMAGLSVVLFVLVRKRFEYGLFLYITSVIVIIVMLHDHPRGRGIDRHVAGKASLAQSLGKKDYLLLYGDYIDATAAPDLNREYHVATTGLLAGDRTINGYTPIGHKGFREILRVGDQGDFHEPRATLDRLFAIDEKTGMTYAEMMRIDRIIAMKGFWAAEVERCQSNLFVLAKDASHTRTYDYTGAYDLPGLVSWVSPGTVIRPAGPNGFPNTRECLDVDDTPAGGGEIMFARLWFPGYKAFLGDQQLEVSAHQLAFVSVALPGSSRGRLVLKYDPPCLRTGILLAGAGLLLFTVVVFCSLPGRQPHTTACAPRL